MKPQQERRRKCLYELALSGEFSYFFDDADALAWARAIEATKATHVSDDDSELSEDEDVDMEDSVASVSDHDSGRDFEDSFFERVADVNSYKNLDTQVNSRIPTTQMSEAEGAKLNETSEVSTFSEFVF